MKRLISFSFLICFCLSTPGINHNRNPGTQVSYIPANGMVPVKATAKKIAEAIWLPIYGERIYAEKPYQAKLINGNVWIVEGTLPKGYALGGVAHIEIQMSDCKILRVIHGK